MNKITAYMLLFIIFILFAMFIANIALLSGMCDKSMDTYSKHILMIVFSVCTFPVFLVAFLSNIFSTTGKPVNALFYGIALVITCTSFGLSIASIE